MNKRYVSYVDPARSKQDPGTWGQRKAAPSQAAE
jgi:hypothetical protein